MIRTDWTRQLHTWYRSALDKKITLAGVLAIGTVVLVAYFPILSSGFHFDDWRNVETIGRMGIGQYIARSFNPMDPSFLNTFRPIQGLLLALEYQISGTNAEGYHLVHVLLHLANSLLLSTIIGKLWGSKRLGVLSGVLYASIAVSSTSVFLPSASDALAMFFSLLAIWFWLIFLREGNRWSFGLTHLLFVLGLLSKEVIVTLPAVLFLVDRLFVRDRRHVKELFRRYAILGLILCVFVLFELLAQPKTVNFQTYGMRWGPHILTNAMGYLPAIVFPWLGNMPSILMWVWVLFIAAALLALRPPAPVLAFIMIWTSLGILPALGLVNNFDLRFLYIASAGPAILLAWISNVGWRKLTSWKYASALLPVAIGALVLMGSRSVQAAAQTYAADARASRTPFRDIVQRRPTFPPDAYLYFVNSPFWVNALSGMFFVRYGDAITVNGTNYNQKAELAAHSNPFLYYFDSSRKPVEVVVQKDANTNVLPQAPITFGGIIQLEGYEISASRLEPGMDVVLLLYWRGFGRIDKDYQFFVHLAQGEEMVAGIDGPLGGGAAPTSAWIPGNLVIDGVVLTVPEDTLMGETYRLEVGVYYLPTMERLPIVDQQGTPPTDHVVIQPLSIQ